MPRFRQTEKIACWVTWVKEVEAENAEEAFDKFNNGEGEVLSETIGDNLDGYEESSIDRIDAKGDAGA